MGIGLRVSLTGMRMGKGTRVKNRGNSRYSIWRNEDLSNSILYMSFTPANSEAEMTEFSSK